MQRASAKNGVPKFLTAAQLCQVGGFARPALFSAVRRGDVQPAALLHATQIHGERLLFDIEQVQDIAAVVARNSPIVST